MIYEMKNFLLNKSGVSIRLILIFNLLSIAVTAKEDQTQMLAKSKSYGFIENKGQVTDQHHNPNPAVMYLLNGNGLNVQVKQGGFSYDIFTIERKSKGVLGKAEPIHALPGKDIPEEEITYHFHRIDITLLGSNPKAQVIAEGKSDDYTNYYNVAHAPDGILHVHQYQKITYKEIYPGIDIEYLYTEKGFKYNFVVHAGANLSDIQLQYKGAPFTASGQTLIFNTSQGEFRESIPASWLIKNGLNQNIQVDYTLLDKETIGFKTKAQIASFDLVVDPSPIRLWATYYGGMSNDYGRTTCSDTLGNIYLGGITLFTDNIATSGSHQSSIGGLEDAFLAKFNTNGIRMWGTYYGGTNSDFGYSVCLNLSGDIFLSGSTKSSNNIATSGSHQPILGGDEDAFLAKFNTNGIRQWSTYYGGTQIDFSYSSSVDLSGNVYLSGSAASTTNISTTGSHQVTNGGSSDGFLAKFNTNGIRQWGTYYGGADYDIGLLVCIDISGNVFLAGRTSSNNNISTVGSHQSNIGGAEDGYLVKFNSNGIRQWGTYYGGSDFDLVFAGACDASGNIHIVGRTNSTTNISSSGAHQVNYGGSGDAFIVKFTTNGSRIWGTYYGGSMGEWGLTCHIGEGGNVFVAGETSSSNNISTVGSFQPALFGAWDAFVAKFNSNGTRQWGTYYGGSGDDGFASVNINTAGILLIAGWTASSGNISSPGSHQVNFGTGTYDAFLVKFQDCNFTGSLGGIGVITSPPATYCANTTYTFYLSSTTANASGYWWIVPVGWVIVSGQNTSTIIVRPSGSGTMSVKAYNNCGDSTIAASRSITVNSAPAQPSAISTSDAQLINGIRTFCNGVSASFNVTNIVGLTYTWIFPVGWSGSGQTNSVTRTVGPTSDTIRVFATNTTGCNSIESKLFVRVFEIPVAPSVIKGGNPACLSGINLFSVDSVPSATTYSWTVPSGWTINSGNGTPNLQVTAGLSTGNISVTAANFCGTSSQKILPITSISAPAQPGPLQSNLTFPICAGTNNLVLSVSNVSGIQYRWVLPNNWQIVSGANSNQITVNVGYNASGGIIQVFPAHISNPLCEGPSRSLNVSVVSFGSMTGISGSSNVCAGSSNLFSTTSISGATSYLWTLPSSWTGSSNQNSITTNVGTIVGTYTISVRGINGVCSSAVAEIQVTVHSQVNQPTSISGNTTICANSLQSYNTPVVSNASSYIWTLPSGWTFNGTSNTNSINTTIGNSSGTFNLSVQAINLGCSSLVRSIPIIVNPPPQIGSISGLTNVCEGSTQSYSVSATNASSFTWSLPSGWTGNSTTNSIGITFNAVADTLRVIANGSGGCSSIQAKRFVNVQAKPIQPLISSIGALCSGQYETFRVNKLNSVSNYTWTVPSGWEMSPTNGISTDTTIQIRPTNGATGSVTVKATSTNGCVGAERVLFISTISSVIPNAPVAINGGNAFCSGLSKVYTIAPVSGATGYLWTIPAGWQIGSGQNTTSLNVIPGSTTGNVRVQTIQGGCKSSFMSLSAAIKLDVPEKPLSITPSNQPICEQSNITIVSNVVQGATSYVWQLPSDWSFIGDPSLRTIQVQVGTSNGNISVRGKNDGCTSDLSLTLPTTLTKLPQFVGGITGEKYVKANSIRTYGITATNATSYVWEIPGNWTLLSGANTNLITVLTGNQSATLKVSAYNTCGFTLRGLDVITGVSASLNEQSIFKTLNIFPIPATDAIQIGYELANNNNIEYQIFGLNGQLLIQGNLTEGKGEANIQVNHFVPGLYFIKFSSDGQAITSRKIQIMR